MTALLWTLAIVIALLFGVVCGYLFALLRTPAVLAKMQPDQIESLARKTAQRRKEAA